MQLFKKPTSNFGVQCALALALAALTGCAAAPVSESANDSLIRFASSDSSAAAAGTVQPPLGPIEKPSLAVGDRWVYRQTELVAGHKTPVVSTYLQAVTKISADRIELRQVATDKTGRIEQGVSRVRRLNLAAMDLESPFKLDGESQLLKFPVQVGSQWRYAYQSNQPTIGTTSYAYVASVKTMEIVSSVAGQSYTSLLVEHQGTWKRQTIEKGKAKTIEGTAVHRYWYSPDVANWVKQHSIRYRADKTIESDVTIELVRADLGALQL